MRRNGSATSSVAAGPLVDEPDGRTARTSGITGVPETFIIGVNGIVAALIGAVGPTTLAELAAGASAATYSTSTTTANARSQGSDRWTTHGTERPT